MAEKGSGRSKDPGRTKDPSTHHATWKTRLEDSGKKKTPGMISYKPDTEERVGTVSTTLKAEVDKNKIIAVTTALSIGKASKMMVKSKAAIKPQQMEKGTALSKPPSPAPTPKVKPPIPAAASAAKAKPFKRKSSILTKPGANKSARKIMFSVPNVAEHPRPSLTRKRKSSLTSPPPAAAAAKAKESKKSKRRRSSHSTKRKSDKDVLPKARSSDKYRPGILREQPEKVPESQETPLPSQDDEIEKPPLPSKAQDDESEKPPLPPKARDHKRKKKKKSSRPPKVPDVDLKPVVSDDEEVSYAKAPKKAEKKTVTVQVIYYRYRDVDTVAETFDAEIILNAKWAEPEFDNSKKLPDRLLKQKEYNWSPELYIENNVIREPKVLSKSWTLQYAPSGEAFVVQSTRLSGKFSESMELSDFPFDIQSLSLLIRSAKPSSEAHLVFSSDYPHLIRRSLYFQEQQFRLYMHVVSEDLSAELYDEFGSVKTSDELKVTCVVARSPVFYIINCYLVALILAILGFWSFAPHAQFTTQRNVLSFFGMVGAIAHKYSLIKHIPKIPYMTHAGRYCLAVIIYLFLLSLWHAVMTNFEVKYRGDRDLPGIILFGSLLLLYHVVVFGEMIIKTIRVRQEMAEEEKKYVEKLTMLKKERGSIDKVLGD